MTDGRNSLDSPAAAAADWVVHLAAGPLDEEEQRAFDRWLAASPAHASALEAAQTAWDEMGALASAPGSLAHHSIYAPANRRRARRGRPGVRLWKQGAMLAASVAVAVGIGSAWFGDPVTFLRADHRTGLAQTRSVTLPDGTAVDLGPASAIALHYTGRERRVELLAGVAYFTVAPKEQAAGRPFIVDAANGASLALGTRFMVDRLPESVDVVVMEHDVGVDATDATGQSRRLTLSPGHRLRYDPRGGLHEVQTANADLALAWQHGQLVFDRAPLSEVAAELNRYRAGRIIIAGNALDTRKVSGVFNASDVDGALDSLARELGARRMTAPLLTVLY